MALLRRASLSFPRQRNPNQLPAAPYEFDGSHPLAQTMVGYWAGSSLVNLANPGVGNRTLGTDGKVGGSPFGPAIINNGTAGQSSLVPSTPSLRPASPTFFAAISTTSATASQYFAGADSGSAGWSFADFGAGGHINSEIFINGSFQSLAGLIAYPAGAVLSMALSYDGANIRFYAAGAQVTSQAQTGVITYTANNCSINAGSGDGTNATSKTSLLVGAIYNSALPADMVAWLSAEPFAMLRPVVRRQYYVIPAGGGSTYTGSWSDSAATSDLWTAGAIFAGLISDAAATGDIISSTAIYSTALADAAATSDAVSGAAVFATALADAITASDVYTATAQYLVTLADAAATADGYTGTATFPAALGDAATTADSLSPTATFPASLADAATTSDGLTAKAALPATLADTLSTAEGYASAAKLAAALADAAATSDGLSAAAIFGAAWADALATAEAYIGSVGSTAYSGSWSDSAASSDGYQAIAVFAATLADTANAADALTAIGVFLAQLRDVAAVSDIFSAATQLLQALPTTGGGRYALIKADRRTAIIRD